MFWNNFKLTKLVKIVVFCTLYSVSSFANLSKVTLPKLRNQHWHIFTNENSILSWTSPGSPLTVLFLVQTQPRRPHWSSLSPLILPSELWLFLSLSLFFMTLTFLKSSSQPFVIPQFGFEGLFFFSWWDWSYELLGKIPKSWSAPFIILYQEAHDIHFTLHYTINLHPLVKGMFARFLHGRVTSFSKLDNLRK